MIILDVEHRRSTRKWSTEMMYILEIASGGTTTEYETYDDAEAAAYRRWPDGVVGHDGDISEGGDRTLVWATEADSVDDPGTRASATIRTAR